MIYRLHSFPDLLQRSHTGRHDDRFSFRCHVLYQRQIDHLKRGDLVEFQSHILQEIHCSIIKGSGQKVDSYLVRLCLKLGLPLPRSVCLTVEAVEILALPGTVIHLKIFVVAINCQGIRRICLNLDTVRTAFFGGMNDLLRTFNTPRMIR